MAGLTSLYFVVLSVTAAAAQPDADIQACRSARGMSAVMACSRVIENTATTQDDLAYAYAARSYHLEQMNDSDDALADINRAIQLKADVAYFYDNRSNAERMLGQLDDAFTDANKALELDPKDMPALLNRGLVHEARKNYDAALVDFSVYIARRTDAAEPFTFRGEVHRKRGEYDLAVADFIQAIALKTDGTRPYRLRGRTYLALKTFDLAIADFSAVLDQHPKDAWALYGRGTAKVQAGDTAGGQADIDKARTLDAKIEAEFGEREF